MLQGYFLILDIDNRYANIKDKTMCVLTKCCDSGSENHCKNKLSSFNLLQDRWPNGACPSNDIIYYNQMIIVILKCGNFQVERCCKFKWSFNWCLVKNTSINSTRGCSRFRNAMCCGNYISRSDDYLLQVIPAINSISARGMKLKR